MFSDLLEKKKERFLFNFDQGSFLQGIPKEKTFSWKSFVNCFQILKLEIEFHSHKKVISPKLNNCAHLFIGNFKCGKFLFAVGMEGGR